MKTSHRLPYLFFLLLLASACSRNHGSATSVAPAPARPPSFAGDPTAVVELSEAYRGLYEGPNAPQVGVAEGAIDPARICIAHGRTENELGAPLVGVRVTVVGAAQFGHTLSRADGSWQLALNGGQPTELRFSLPGRAPAQRTLQPGWRDQQTVETVVLVARARSGTPIEANAPTPQRVVGEPSDDADGARRALLIVPAGTTASAHLPGGQQQDLPTFTVRATEYTVGACGRQRMPADYAENIGYTYAIEYVCDEAEALGALSVHFSKPVVHYVENFLHFPVGQSVPSGFFDAERRAWVPTDDGRVVRVLEIVAGKAVLDVSGSGVPATAAETSMLGIDDDELTMLAAVHGAGAQLWRVPLRHFTPCDLNWPYGPPSTATAPQQPTAGLGQLLDALTQLPNIACGSIVLVQDQVLMESLVIPGTGLRLVYRSDRATGFVARARVPLTGSELPPGLLRVEFVAKVAGRTFAQSFAPAPNLSHDWVFDGRDAAGLRLQGKQRASIEIGYTYAAVYQQPRSTPRAFGQFSGVAMTNNPTRQEVTLWQRMQGFVGGFDARGLGLGGWTLDVHHAYDAEAKVLLRGDGETVTTDPRNDVVATIAGQPGASPGYTNGPATQALLAFPSDVHVGPDGCVYWLEGDLALGGSYAPQSALRKIDRNGITSTVAGGMARGFAGDHGPATNAQLNAPNGFTFAPDGSIWIADTDNHCIRRIGSDGIITTVAGTPTQQGSSGDGGLAVNARLRRPSSVVVAPDGNAFVADKNNHRVRRIGTDGVISTVAGTGSPGLAAAELPGHESSLNLPDCLALDARGRLYIAQSTHALILCLGADGILRRVAGTGVPRHLNTGVDDHVTALGHPIGKPNGLTVACDGSLLFSEEDAHCIRRIAPDGMLTTLVGRIGVEGHAGDGGAATAAVLDTPQGLAVAPDGALYIAETGNHTLRRIGSPWPGYGAGEKVCVAADGSALFVFDARGRHLRTDPPLRRTPDEPLVQFGYDASHRLTTVTTVAGTTEVRRDRSGQPTEILSPGRASTKLQVNSEGLLTQLELPDGRRLQFTYRDGGLLTKIRFADGSEQTFDYDATGRLVRDADATGRAIDLAVTRTADQTTATVTSTERRVQSYLTRSGSAPEEEVRVASTCCSQTATSIWSDGTTELRRDDGYRLRQTLRDDPVFGRSVRAPATIDLFVPGTGNAANPDLHVEHSRTVSFDDANNPRSVRTMVDSLTSNGATWQRTFDRSAGAVRMLTPEGRWTTVHLDARLRTTGIDLPGQARFELTHDVHDRLASLRRSANGFERLTTYGYFADGWLRSMTDANGDTLIIERDPCGQPTGLRPNGLAGPTFGYGAAGHLTTVTPPGKPAHTLGRDAAGRLVRYTPPGGFASVFHRDGDGLVDRIDLAEQSPLVVRREAGSTRVTGIDVGPPRLPGTITFTYDAASGMLASATTPEGIVVATTHHGPLPHTVQTTVAGAALPLIRYTYGSDLRVDALTIGSLSFAHGYDQDGLLTTVGNQFLTNDAASGALLTRTVNAFTQCHVHYDTNTFGELANLEAGNNTTTWLSQLLQRDAAGRITRIHDGLSGIDTDYTYDARGRLRTVVVGGATTVDLRYDDNGNPLQDLAPGGRTFTSNDQDQMLQAGAVAFAYDAAGRLRTRTTANGTTTYTYDSFGNLLQVALPGGTTIEYAIDAFHRRVQRRVTEPGQNPVTHDYVHGADGRLLAERRNGTWRYFVYGSRPNVPDYLREGSVDYLLVHDHLGSVRKVVNTNTGTVVQSLDYDVFGNVLASSTNPGFQPFGFAGGLGDPSTGLVRFGARDYAPETMRWTARDPALFAGGTSNLYEYCNGDPVNWIDTDGLAPEPAHHHSPLDMVNDYMPFTSMVGYAWDRERSWIAREHGNSWRATAMRFGIGPAVGFATLLALDLDLYLNWHREVSHLWHAWMAWNHAGDYLPPTELGEVQGPCDKSAIAPPTLYISAPPMTFLRAMPK